MKTFSQKEFKLFVDRRLVYQDIPSSRPEEGSEQAKKPEFTDTEKLLINEFLKANLEEMKKEIKEGKKDVFQKYFLFAATGFAAEKFKNVSDYDLLEALGMKPTDTSDLAEKTVEELEKPLEEE